jgi:serine/threonine protein kinase
MTASRAAAVAPRTALVVDRYAVYDEFAAGGMATVHFARLLGAQGFRRTVAAKRLLPHLTRDRDLALSLVDEARLAARVRHPNVVSTLDVVQTEGELLLVMEYVHGESLAKLAGLVLARGERVPLAIAAAILSDALQGLHAAHEAKDERGAPLQLVHRDVSPQNVLVGLDGITRIADFGVAKAVGRMHSTRDGAIKGKLAYMAPEQLNAGDVTRRTDVFAAAVVLWELLTGEPLFAGDSHAETIFNVVSAPIIPPSAHGAVLPPGFEAVVMRGLERDPTLRFASAREMALALDACAPSVRPSEIAAWVERIAGEHIAQRARLLSEIEHEEEPAPAVSLRPTAASEPAHEPAREPGEHETGRRRRDSGPESAATLPALREPAAPASSYASPRSSFAQRAAAVAVALLVLSGISWAARSRWSSSVQHASSAPAIELRATSHATELPKVERLAPETPAPETSALDTASIDLSPAELPRAALPVSELPPAELPPANLANSSKPDAPAKPPSLDANRGPAAQQASRAADKRPTPPQRKGVSKWCDPPYTVDAAGRVLFKVECM